MNAETIVANNLLIAQFMEFDIVEEEKAFDGKKLVFYKIMGSPPVELQYHCDWSWLMPVVEKITMIKYDGEKENVYLRTFCILDEENNYMVRFYRMPLFKAKTLFDATYLAVVDFVKYYIGDVDELPFP